jgi:prepilin-type N-terminal cleavage/methylation domain-containing protein
MKRLGFELKVLSSELLKIFHLGSRMEDKFDSKPTPSSSILNKKRKWGRPHALQLSFKGSMGATHKSKLPLGEEGVTMIEYLIVIAIIGIVMSAIATISLQAIKSYGNQNARLQMESQAQNFIYILTEKLRQAAPGTVSISNFTPPAENNESMIIFTEINQSNPVSIYLKTTTGTGGKVLDRRILMFEPLYSVSGGVTTVTYSTGGNVLASNVVSLYFTYPMINNNSRIQVSLSQEKIPFAKQVPVDLQTTQVIYTRN